MPLRGILRRLGRLPDASANNAQRKSQIGGDAWKRCCANGSPARAENAEVVRLRARSEEQAVEVREAEAVHHDVVREVERLLNMAQVPDAEAFYRRHGGKAGTGKRSSAAAKIWRTPCVWRLGICMGRMPIFRRFRLVRRGGQKGLGSGARRPRGPPVHACGRRGAACRFPAYAGDPSGQAEGLGNAFPSAPSGCVAFRDHTGLGFGMEPVRAGPHLFA